MGLPDLLLQLGFWACVAALVHSYVIYPGLVTILAKRKHPGNSRCRPELSEEALPHLVVALAAHNEELVIGDTLESLFATDYPPDRLEIVIAADNCSDGTHGIVEAFARRHANLALRIFPGRNGKIRVINQVLSDGFDRWSRQGDFVLVLCDANVRWAPDLPRRLANAFQDPRVGLVAPVVLDDREHHGGIADYEEAYVNRENAIKHAEGVLWGRMMGAFGACYALRGKLFEAVPEDHIVDDFYHTMRCYEQGYDGIVDPKAACFEDVSEEIGEEYRRKQRIAMGNFQNLVRFWPLVSDPLRHFGTSFAFWSHKGLRWIGPFLLLGALATSAILAPGSLLYSLALLGQATLVGVAGIDAVLTRRGLHFRVTRAIRYFYLMNLALLVGAIRYLSGVRSSVWEPTRRVAPQAHALPPASLAAPLEPESRDPGPTESPTSR